MKKISALILVCAMMLLLVACGGKNSGEKEGTGTIPDTAAEPDETENGTEDDAEDSETAISQEEAEAEAVKAKQQKFRDCVDNMKVYVLSSTVVDAEQSRIDSYTLYCIEEERYTEATIVTLLVTSEEDLTTAVYAMDHLDEGFCIEGEGATAPSGNRVGQTCMYTRWLTDDKKSAIVVISVCGRIDLTKSHIAVIDEDAEVHLTKEIENGGEPTGYEYARERFESDLFGTGSLIVKLKGRHYIITRAYCSETGWGSSDDGTDVSTTTYSYILIPIEGGYGRTLVSSDIQIVSVPEDYPACKLVCLANEHGRLDYSNIEEQTTIEVEVKRYVTEPRDADGDYPSSFYNDLTKEKKAYLSESVVGIDDGDGNTVEFRPYYR